MMSGARLAGHRYGRVAATLAVLVVVTLAAGCGASPASHPSPVPAPHSAPAGPGHPRPAGTTTGPGTAALGTASPPGSAPAAPAFHASTSVLTAQMRARMTGVSWRPGCPVGLGQLRLLTLSYWGFDHAAHTGQLIVSAAAAMAVTRAFAMMFAARFPIRRMRPVDVFGGDDERSMRADNTSAFSCRIVPGTSVWSQHAYGLAVDINPLQNPEISNGLIDPPAAAPWADRSRSSAGMIKEGDAAWQAFRAVGWIWGGDWTSPKDYMHFSANGL
jgi:D-alanyl-D-alanine carboxypeptidase-like protein